MIRVLVAGVAAALLAAGCSSTDKPKPTPLEPLAPKMAAPPGVDCQGRQRSLPPGDGGQRRHVDGGRQRRQCAGAECRRRPYALARRSRRAHHGRRRQRRPLRRRGDARQRAGRVRPGPAEVACEAGLARHDGAARGRRARFRGGRRPGGQRLRCARRPQALDAAASRRCADAVAGRCAAAVQGHAAGGPGSAACRRRSAEGFGALGGCHRIAARHQ